MGQIPAEPRFNCWFQLGRLPYGVLPLIDRVMPSPVAGGKITRQELWRGKWWMRPLGFHGANGTGFPMDWRAVNLHRWH